jgi:DNA polymerase-3 subunit delta'
LSVLPFAETPAWRKILSAFAVDSVPHCWAVTAPFEWHGTLLEAMARLYLCDGGAGSGNGVFRHPDLIVAGELDKAANIDACRALIRELSLRPVAARRRLGVLPAADKLLLPAANSLLKIAEEPPPHACLLFLMEGNGLLPTLRSRSRLTVIAAAPFVEPHPAPLGEAEWLTWLGSAKDEKDMEGVLASWTAHLLREGDPESAARIERIRLLVSQKKLSQTMVCDLLILTLKEGLPFEHIFGGFR